jgi:hypothetical protein
MKKYFNIYAKTFLFTNIVLLVLAVAVVRNTNYNVMYIRVIIASIIISIFIALGVFVFKLEKGNSIVNTVIGYILILPALIVVRNTFGNYLFSRVWYIYIIFAIIGIIYGIALMVANKKYKKEVSELNRLLLKKQEDDDEE